MTNRRIRVIPTRGSTELHIDYDGRHPPLELFSAWTELGWIAPTPASPPRSAIDWTTPDRETGTKYTISSWPASGVATLPARASDPHRRLQGALAVAIELGCEVDASEADNLDITDIDLSGLGARRPADAHGETHISVTVSPETADEIVAEAEAHGAVVHTTPTTTQKTVRYRGSTNVTETPAVVIDLSVSASSADAVLSSLRSRGMHAPRVDPGR